MSDFFAARLGEGRTPQNALNWSSLFEQPQPPRTKESAPGWSTPEAFVAILFSAVTCDGELAPVEHEELLALAHRSRALKSLSTAQLAALNAQVLERLRQSDSALEEACKALPQDARLSAFAHALDLVLADGELNQDEADFLNAIILYLRLDRADVERIADVMVLKNQY